jgi:hypothetical protein
LELRAAIYAQTPAETLRPWGEKLLRYAEIKFPAVETLHESLRLPVFAAAMLTSFFMDYFAVTGDYRFLNVALKLLDYQNARGGCRGVGPGLMSLVVETLHCRNHMLAESALKKL